MTAPLPCIFLTRCLSTITFLVFIKATCFYPRGSKHVALINTKSVVVLTVLVYCTKTQRNACLRTQIFNAHVNITAVRWVVCDSMFEIACFLLCRVYRSFANYIMINFNTNFILNKSSSSPQRTCLITVIYFID
jgi:hypothetical protein